MSAFVKITSGDHWFKKHPEKIAGVEVETSSRDFPIQVKGTKDDVLRVTGMNKANNRIKIARAKAILIQLQLNK